MKSTSFGRVTYIRRTSVPTQAESFLTKLDRSFHRFRSFKIIEMIRSSCRRHGQGICVNIREGPTGIYMFGLRFNVALSHSIAQTNLPLFQCFYLTVLSIEARIWRLYCSQKSYNGISHIATYSSYILRCSGGTDLCPLSDQDDE
jgi:hypothetical protein